jgi:Flp pilus assembly protein TadG
MLRPCHPKEKISRRTKHNAPGDLVQDCNGAGAVEFAVIAPLFAIMIVLTADLAIGVFKKMQVEGAAQAGAQYAIIHGFDSSAITSAVTNATNNSGISSSPAPAQFCGCPEAATGITATSCSTICASGNAAGTYVTVSAQGTYDTLIHYTVVPSSYTFNAQSTVRLK